MYTYAQQICMDDWREIGMTEINNIHNRSHEVGRSRRVEADNIDSNMPHAKLETMI